MIVTRIMHFRPVIPEPSRVKKSYSKYNVSHVYNEVVFDPSYFGGGAQNVGAGGTQNLVLVAGILVILSSSLMSK